MGAMKKLLMDMQEHAYWLLEQDQSTDEARIEFLKTYPDNEEVFENVRAMTQDPHFGNL